MTLIYISHLRMPAEKTATPFILKTCEMFAKNGVDLELWIPWRNNRHFAGMDPFFYHHVEKNFVIRRLPSFDLTGFLPGKLFFYILLFSFNVSLIGRLLFYRTPEDAVFYFHDARDMFLSLPFIKRPVFLEIHDFYKSSFKLINDFCFPRVRGFIVTNLWKIAELEKKFGISKEKMLHQPNAVDLKIFNIDTPKKDARDRLNLSQDVKIILYTGHLFSWKGVDTLFEAHRFLGPEEIIYFVGGTNKDIEKFKIKSEKLKIKNIVVVGRRPHDEIPLWLRAADVLVLPNTAKEEASKYETSPVKLFEYMASGRPIVASDLPSIRNIVDEKAVFFFEPDNSRSLADLLLFVLQSEDETKRRVDRARREVRKYSWTERTNAIIYFMRSKSPIHV